MMNNIDIDAVKFGLSFGTMFNMIAFMTWVMIWDNWSMNKRDNLTDELVVGKSLMALMVTTPFTTWLVAILFIARCNTIVDSLNMVTFVSVLLGESLVALALWMMAFVGPCLLNSKNLKNNSK